MPLHTLPLITSGNNKKAYDFVFGLNNKSHKVNRPVNRDAIKLE